MVKLLLGCMSPENFCLLKRQKLDICSGRNFLVYHKRVFLCVGDMAMHMAHYGEYLLLNFKPF
jgi:hypothetical protein